MKIDINVKDKIYPVYIENGSINSINNYIDTAGNYLIISDKMVASIYLENLMSQFNNALSYVIEIGEKSKSMEVLLEIVDMMIESKIDKSYTLIALGGGIVTDIVGFIASIYLRGVEFISIPTSVVAQVDSSVGGKTGVNHIYKNMLGTFYHPKMVIVDPMTLKTLSNREFNAGLVEVLKIFMLFDKEMLESIVYGDYSISDVIIKAVEYKARVVEKDERDTSYRHCLNLGHTVGHALEKQYEYNGLLHGEAVFNGLYYSVNPDFHYILNDYLKRYEITTIKYIDIDQIFEHIQHDKKRNDNLITFVYLNEIENFEFKKLSINELRNELEKNYEQHIR